MLSVFKTAENAALHQLKKNESSIHAGMIGTTSSGSAGSIFATLLAHTSEASSDSVSFTNPISMVANEMPTPALGSDHLRHIEKTWALAPDTQDTAESPGAAQELSIFTRHPADS